MAEPLCPICGHTPADCQCGVVKPPGSGGFSVNLLKLVPLIKKLFRKKDKPDDGK